MPTSMNNRDNRSSLNWVHFWCGAVLGAVEGARVAFALFSHWWSIILVIVGAAAALGLCCGFWSESAWEVLSLFDWL